MRTIVSIAAISILACANAMAADPNSSKSGNGDAADKSSVLTIATPKAMETDKEYWTPERLKNAKPMETPTISEKELQKLQMEAPQSAVEKPQIKEGSPPHRGNAEKKAMTKATTPGVPERANVNERPYWNGGKLYFTKPGGGDYVCSAQFTGQNNILLTAAHCVRDGTTGAWNTNFKFFRAYNNGGGQSVTTNCAVAYYMWFTPHNNFKYDYAFLRTNQTSGAGWLGWKTGIPYNTWTAIGYPANYGNNQYMYKVDGSKGTVANGIVQMLNNPMRSGNSGGAWIAEVTTPRVGGNYAVGLNSFHVGNDQTSEYGPYFDGDFVTLYNKAVKCAE